MDIIRRRTTHYELSTLLTCSSCGASYTHDVQASPSTDFVRPVYSCLRHKPKCRLKSYRRFDQSVAEDLFHIAMYFGIYTRRQDSSFIQEMKLRVKTDEDVYSSAFFSKADIQTRRLIYQKLLEEATTNSKQIKIVFKSGWDCVFNMNSIRSKIAKDIRFSIYKRNMIEDIDGRLYAEGIYHPDGSVTITSHAISSNLDNWNMRVNCFMNECRINYKEFDSDSTEEAKRKAERRKLRQELKEADEYFDKNH